jgi:hypothetical protein
MERLMSESETLYLGLVILSALVFGVTLAWVSWRAG